MNAVYDRHYKTENLFGDPYPELMEFFQKHHRRGTVLDLGAGQGRNALALASLGYEVTGIDISQVGVTQMDEVARLKKLSLTALVGDIYKFDRFSDYDMILLDNMFHFDKRHAAREKRLLRNILKTARSGALIIVCIQSSGQKVETLHDTILKLDQSVTLSEIDFTHNFRNSGGQQVTHYHMVIERKT